MKFTEIKEGEWYRIDCRGSSEIAYSGAGLVLRKQNICYPKGTIKVLCIDGRLGYFSSRDFKGQDLTPGFDVVNKLLLDFARTA